MADLNQTIQNNGQNPEAFNGAPTAEERTAAAAAKQAEASINNAQGLGSGTSGKAVSGSLKVQYTSLPGAIKGKGKGK